MLKSGVFTAALTPMHDDLSLDHSSLKRHCEWLLGHGSDGVALLGTTGEANSFSFGERRDLIEQIADWSIPSGSLMIGTGCCSIPETIALTRSAVKAGAGGILMLPPFFYTPVDDYGVLKYFDRVINGVQDDRLKIYLYHIPALSGVPISIKLIGLLRDKYPDFVVGMKDSGGDFEYMKRVRTIFPRLEFYAGTEQYLLPILQVGGVGCISTTANITCTLAAKVFQKWSEGEDATSLQSDLTKLKCLFDNIPAIGALKALLWEREHAIHWKNIRPPNILLDEMRLDQLRSKLNAYDEVHVL